jgi:predicted metalloendopeptidase
VDIRNKYVAHVTNMFKLVGEPEAQAKTDAATVLAMETEFAKSAMDIVKRRDPKNINNKMTLAQVEKLAPAFGWKEYLAAVHAPAAPSYIVTSVRAISEPSFCR